MLKLLITDKIDESEITPLKKYFKIDKRIGITQDKLNKIIADYDCTITRSSTAISGDLIEKATKLKIIARAGIGVDNIDIFAASERKIAVINAPKGNAKVTAEHTIGLIFALMRHIPQAMFDLKRGVWGKSKYIGTKISGKILGIVGFGNVGKEVYRVACAIGMEVVVCEPYVQLPEKVRKVTFEELLKISDVITLHVPLTYLTKHMINKFTVGLCKRGVYLVNCSRGEVVEIKAIKNGLETGHIAGFAIDVYSQEPPVDNILFKYPNVIATPHIAGLTIESLSESTAEIVSGILAYLKGMVPENLLNPQVFQKKIREKSNLKFDFENIIFDCDSTLTRIEGIDEIAGFVGKYDEVAQLTAAAMEGAMPLEKVFDHRLAIVKPSRENLTKLGRLYIETLVEDAKGVIEALHLLGKKVYIVSGGYSQALFTLGQHLGIPSKNIFGNELIHDEAGLYRSYISGPLKRNNGKLQIIRQISGRKLFVGDSITDFETHECVDLFVGYGGVVRRPNVERECEVYLRSASFSPILIIGSGFGGSVKLLSTKFRRYIGKGLDILSHSLHTKVSSTLLPRFAQFKQLAHY